MHYNINRTHHTPLNNADHGGSFYLFKEKFKLNPEKDQFKVKPPKTYKEQIEIYLEKYSSGLRGAPTKGIGQATGARFHVIHMLRL